MTFSYLKSLLETFCPKFSAAMFATYDSYDALSDIRTMSWRDCDSLIVTEMMMRNDI